MKREMYKGFEIDYFICRKGFNQYKITVRKFKNKGFREEEYYWETLETYTNKKAEARKQAYALIDSIGRIRWSSQGLLKCRHLPSIHTKVN